MPPRPLQRRALAGEVDFHLHSRLGRSAIRLTGRKARSTSIAAGLAGGALSIVLNPFPLLHPAIASSKNLRQPIHRAFAASITEFLMLEMECIN